jgi:DSF synthase
MLDPARVERMILSGRIFTAEELYDQGVIDYIFEDDHGVQEIDLFIKKLEKSKNTRKAILKIRNRINPVTFEEMLDIGEIWVESAMALSQKEVKVMQRLVRSQDRMAKSLLHAVAIDLPVDKVSI